MSKLEEQKQITPAAPLRTRIAPTPSGYLHLGNVLSFALTWVLARKQNGVVVLRIDDLDSPRFRPEYLHDIFETLHFMGLNYDEGPQDAADFMRHYSQLNRLSVYQELLQQLADGGLIYTCPCSRSQIVTVSPEGLYPLTCRNRHLPLHMPGAAWRIRLPEDTVVRFTDLIMGAMTVPLAAEMPDFVIRRKDGIPAYQVASVCDDVLMGINLVVRGQDLLASTAAQLFLARQAGADGFTSVRFAHHPLVHESNGNKLSKSHDSLSIHEMRKRGVQAEEVWQALGRLLGWEAGAALDARSFLDRFRLEELKAGLHPI